MAKAIEAHDAGELPAFVRMLALMADDPLLGDLFAPQIAIGWRCYVALVEGVSCASWASGDPMWERWLRKVRGEHETVLVTTRHELAAQGFIVQTS